MYALFCIQHSLIWGHFSFSLLTDFVNKNKKMSVAKVCRKLLFSQIYKPIIACQAKRTFYLYSSEPFHPIPNRQPIWASAEEAVQRVVSGKWVYVMAVPLILHPTFLYPTMHITPGHYIVCRLSRVCTWLCIDAVYDSDGPC